MLLQENRVYQQGEKVEVRGVLQHLDISHGEPRENNTKLRIIYPAWLRYDREGGDHLVHPDKNPKRGVVIIFWVF